MRKKVIIIGGGAAGFFGALSCAEADPDAEISIMEKNNKLLSKVKISGGGRCNVTNDCPVNSQLIKNYPRGSKALKKLFEVFSVRHTVEWFHSKGVALKTEPDKRMFPVSDNSQTIIDCLITEARKKGINIYTGTGVKQITPAGRKFNLYLSNGTETVCDKLLIATGGNPEVRSYSWLTDLGHEIISPVPSLFTFNIPSSPFSDLQGVSVTNAHVRIQGADLAQSGPLLITHWGLSGPAVLRLSAWGARELNQLSYKFSILVNWIPEFSEETLRNRITGIKEENPIKIISSNPCFGLPRRLWERLAEQAGISPGTRWTDLSKKHMNKLIEGLLRTQFQVSGKTTFKEEFVTCGGVSLNDIDLSSMESLKCPGIYFAGEVLDIDGVTGGFNFQAAWTTGWIAGKGIGNKN